MGSANQSLSEFVGFLSSPDMYGSMSTAAGMMAWLLQLVVFILMVCAVIGVAFIVFKFACDIVFLSGLGHMMKGGKLQGFVDKFASDAAKESDIMGYLKKDVWKLIVTLAFVGILASGMALPLAGQVAGVTGAVISKLVGIDIAGKVEDFDYDDFKDTIKLMSTGDVKSEYDAQVQAAKNYRDQLYTLGSRGQTAGNEIEIEQKKNLYAISLAKAQALAEKAGDNNTSGGSYYGQHKASSVCISDLLDGISAGVSVSCNN